MFKNFSNFFPEQNLVFSSWTRCTHKFVDSTSSLGDTEFPNVFAQTQELLKTLRFLGLFAQENLRKSKEILGILTRILRNLCKTNINA